MWAPLQGEDKRRRFTNSVPSRKRGLATHVGDGVLDVPRRRAGCPHPTADQRSTSSGAIRGSLPTREDAASLTAAAHKWRRRTTPPSPSQAPATPPLAGEDTRGQRSSARATPIGLRPLATLPQLPFPGLLRDGPPMARLRKLRPRFICHWQREAAIPPAGEARVLPLAQGKHFDSTERRVDSRERRWYFALSSGIIRPEKRCGTCFRRKTQGGYKNGNGKRDPQTAQ